MSWPNPDGTALVVAAHPDDEVLGCGGTIARWAAQGCPVHVLILADGESSRPGDAPALAARRESSREANRILGSASVDLLDYPDNQLDTLPLLTLVKEIEARISRFRPAVILTHHSGDVNIDHRIVHDAVIAAARPQPGYPVRTLLFFEVPSSTEWRPPSSQPAFAPDWFIDISATLPAKLSALDAYREEIREFPHPRSLPACEHLAHWRGASVGLPAAEAFALGRHIDVGNPKVSL